MTPTLTHIQPVLVVLVMVCLAVAMSSTTTRGGITTAPVIEDSHDVQFFLLESSFPFNAPDSIKNTAGNVFQKYYITHAGLGVWDTTDDVKFTIEFVSESYVGALLPDFNDATSQLVWENGGKVVFTTPTVDSDWLESQLVCDTSGNAYTQLVTYLQTNMDVFQYYQPVEVVYYNASSNVLNNTDYTSNQLQASGNLKVSKQDSFWFTNLLINQLSTYGATVEAYLTIYATSFQYLSLYDVAPGVVTWEPEGPANADVYRWYQQLSACYQSNYDVTAASNLGGEYFLNSVKSCYGDYAYVFLNDYSVYNVTLGNYSTEDSSPKLTRYIFDLMDNGTGAQESLQVVDYLLITVFFIGLIAGAWYIAKRICRAPQRRRVSIQGEKVATRAVDKLTAGANGNNNSDNSSVGGNSRSGVGGDGSVQDEHDIHQSYYRSKSTDDQSIMMTVFSAVTTVTNSVNPANLMAGMSNSSRHNEGDVQSSLANSKKGSSANSLNSGSSGGNSDHGASNV